ncbi:MAG: hypothetical protein J6M02_04565 [Clostridia bacterium]|nr:hypothetical protein [Clostridia bacterium]
MEIFYGPDFCVKENCAVAFGKFDGLHEGHLRLLHELIDLARKRGLKSVVYTFDKNPRAFLSGVELRQLMSIRQKNAMLEKLGVDVVVYERFDEKFSQISPEEFVKEILLKKLSMKAVVMGSNSTFGKNGAGNIALMKFFGEKYDFFVKEVELLYKEGILVCSSNIRKENLSDLG